MIWRWFGCSVLLAIFCTVGCSDNTARISDENYDRSCASNSDCVPVWTGNVCTCDDLGSVNASDLQRYRTEKSTRQDQCSSRPECVEPKSRWRAVCNGSTCNVERRADDADSGGDASRDDASSDTAAAPDAAASSD